MNSDKTAMSGLKKVPPKASLRYHAARKLSDNKRVLNALRLLERGSLYDWRSEKNLFAFTPDNFLLFKNQFRINCKVVQEL